MEDTRETQQDPGAAQGKTHETTAGVVGPGIKGAPPAPSDSRGHQESRRPSREWPSGIRLAQENLVHQMASVSKVLTSVEFWQSLPSMSKLFLVLSCADAIVILAFSIQQLILVQR